MARKMKKNAEMNVPTKEEALRENNVVEEDSPVCQECGFRGKLLEDGRCANCGAIGGLPAHESEESPYDPNKKVPYSRSRSAAALQEALAQAISNRWNFMEPF